MSASTIEIWLLREYSAALSEKDRAAHQGESCSAQGQIVNLLERGMKVAGIDVKTAQAAWEAKQR